MESCELDYIKSMSEDKHFECVGLKYNTNTKQYFLILSIYRSPDGNMSIFLRKIEEAVRLLIEKNKQHNIVICGDFNINFLKPSKDLNYLMDIFNAYCIKTSIREPTRINNCLDNICLKLDGMYNTLVIDNGISDHNALLLSIYKQSGNEAQSNIGYRCTSNPVNIEYFGELLARENWEDLNMLKNVNEKFEQFIKVLQYYFELAFPMKLKKPNGNNQKNWITQGLRISSQKQKELYKLSLTGDANIKDHYKKYRKIYRQVMQAAKKKYNDELITNSANKSKTAWKIIKGSNINKSPVIELNINNNLVSEGQTVCNYFNEYFNVIPIKLSPRIDTELTVTTEVKNNDASFFFRPVDELELLHVVKSLKNSYSCGSDNFSTNLLKKCVDFIKRPLLNLINLSFSKGVFPESLKIGKIRPIFKTGEKNRRENYRPITLLSSFSKIFEKCAVNRLTSFFEKYELFNKNQFGFKKGSSTTDALTKFINMICENLDNSNKCIGLFLDLSKAFDLVNHTVLLNKLERYGIRGIPWDWFNSYLTNRTHYVEVNGSKSNILGSSSGVPQGSVLGPLLYIIYVNDFCCPNAILFADDTTLLISDHETASMVTKANELLNETYEWIAKNRLVLNFNKTKFMKFNSIRQNNDHIQIKLNTDNVEQVTTTKFLGLNISSNCTWTSHIDEICKKAASTCYCVYQLSKVVSRPVLISFYHAYFQSTINYAIITWGCSPEAERVFKLQKRAVRSIVCVNRRTSCRDIFRELKILPLPCQYILSLAIYAKSNLRTSKTLNSNHSYNTRNGNIMEIPNHRLKLYENSPMYASIKVHNKLPNSYKHLNNKIFKSKIKKFLVEKCYYSLTEYLNDDMLEE